MEGEATSSKRLGRFEAATSGSRAPWPTARTRCACCFPDLKCRSQKKLNVVNIAHATATLFILFFFFSCQVIAVLEAVEIINGKIEDIVTFEILIAPFEEERGKKIRPSRYLIGFDSRNTTLTIFSFTSSLQFEFYYLQIAATIIARIQDKVSKQTDRQTDRERGIKVKCVRRQS